MLFALFAMKSQITFLSLANRQLNIQFLQVFHLMLLFYVFFFTSSEFIIKENYIQRFKSAPDTGKRNNNNKCMQAEGNILKLKEKVLHIKKNENYALHA